MTSLNSQIKLKMQEKGLSAHALEKKAGLKQSAVQNILYGRSKNPTIQIIQAIAQALNCTVSDLLGEDEVSLICEKHSSEHFLKKSKLPWNCHIYLSCLEAVCQILNKKKHYHLSKEQILDYVDEVYIYSLKRKTVDKHFCEWIIEKSIG